MSIALWVWNLNKEDISRFFSFCCLKGVDKLYFNYECKAPKEGFESFEFVPLIGDSQNKLSVFDILKICKPYKRVHLDIELATGETREHFYDKLKRVIQALKYQNKYVELDVECWNKDLEYLNIVKMADELTFMNYDNNIWKQLWMAFPFVLLNKPFYMGIETNPDLKCRTLEPDKRIKEFDKYISHKNYLGTAIHCWSYWK